VRKPTKGTLQGKYKECEDEEKLLRKEGTREKIFYLFIVEFALILIRQLTNLRIKSDELNRIKRST
jgi:hypothetical protein